MSTKAEPRTQTAQPVQSLDIVRERLNHLHRVDGLHWREIALLEPYRGLTPGMLVNIAKGHNPKDPRIRSILRLPEGIDGPGARDCACGRTFIPNAWNRVHCYVCSPPRGSAGTSNRDGAKG